LRILWVRHTPTLKGRTTRDAYLLPRLAREHDIEVVTWEDAESAAGAPWRRLAFRKTESLGLPTWVLPKLPRPPGWRVWWASINQPIFRMALRMLERRFRPDVVVVGPCWTAMGFPPRTRALRVFDYLDGGDWTHPGWRAADVAYLDWCEAVIAVSGSLAERTHAWGREVELIPNGLELDRLLALGGEREALRARHALTGRRVVSLVGLTASSGLYWIDAIRELARKVDQLLFVAVGCGPLASAIEGLARELPAQVRWLGPVPYQEALELFAASDVTWYPGEDTGYFHNASPLKVFEGLGAGTQVVVAPRLRSLAGLSLPTLHFASPTAASLAEVTARALLSPEVASAASRSAALSRYSWDVIATQASGFLRAAVARKQPAPVASDLSGAPLQERGRLRYGA
jgi:glycosyltransferase involved in cell wall biosynthesis